MPSRSSGHRLEPIDLLSQHGIQKMIEAVQVFSRRAAVALAALATCLAVAAPASAYTPINPLPGARTVTLTGHDLNIDQIVSVARFGAKVTLTSEARARSASAYGLLLEAATEGVPVYWFNRGSGDQREINIFTGDPLSAENQPKLAAMQLKNFQRGAHWGFGPEIADEDLVRAMMVIRANTMSYEAASPQLTQMLLDLLNDRITPVAPSRGTVGEGDLAILGAIGGAMVGEGDVYYQGKRMPAAQALSLAGLAPLKPFAADEAALISSNAYAVAQAALLVADARDALDWADLIYAIDLNGMNSSISPLSMPVQTNRPFYWLNWDAKRVMNLIRGSYLFELDQHRIIQDPESMRASSQRQGAAWQAWNQLDTDVLIAVNSSDHNPAVRPGLSPTDSWELSSPQLMRFYVKGGPESHGQHGYIFSNANWDPYPLANDLEAFTNALANMDVAVVLRMQRFSNPFFTVIKPQDFPAAATSFERLYGGGFLSVDLWQEVQGLATPVPPEGQPVVASVEDLQAQTRLKAARGRQAVDDTFHLLSQDLLIGSLWMDLRRLQDPTRSFGAGPTAANAAVRREMPIDGPESPTTTQPGYRAYDFLKAHPAREFFPAEVSDPMPPANLPTAQAAPAS